MIEVGCAVCGAVYRFAPIDIPVGGKTVTCAKCKARIVVQAPPAPPRMTGGTGDVIDLGGGGGDRPRPTAEVVDLPAPKLMGPPPTEDIVDLPAPRLVPRERAPEPLTLDNIDLLAPVGPTRSPPAALPPLLDTSSGRSRVIPASIPDLPAPKRASEPARPSFAPVSPSFASPQASMLPPVVAPARGPAAPLPERTVPPSAATTGAAESVELPDLLTPKHGGPARDLFDDLPSARGPSLADLPTPKRASAPGAPAAHVPLPPGVTDLPAPKGFFDDLPRPAPHGGERENTTDLAPKGFFDDLPQPAPHGGERENTTDLAPKGFFDDLPQPAGPGRSDLPAPKGFFDDLPQPAGPGRPDLPAPKGFFDDLPQPANQSRSDVPVPKGFFDDLPQPGHAASGVDLPVPRDFFDDVPLQSQGPRPAPSSSPRTVTRGDDGPPPRTVTRTAGGDAAPPPLDLGDDHLSGLDLPSPDGTPIVPATRTGVVAFKAGDGVGPGRPTAPTSSNKDLDLAGPARRATTSPPVAPRTEEVVAPPRSRLRKVALIAALGVALAGAGGYVLYDRWQTRKDRIAATERSLATAHKALLAGDWRRAVGAAKKVLTGSPGNGEALATAALAQLAGYYDEGTGQEARVKAGRSLLDQARLASAKGPTMAKALALDTLIEGDAKTAIERLTPMVAGDPEALLYLGWAQLAAEHWDEAAATFERTATATPGRKLAATYGRAQALLGKGDRDGARAQFLAVIALDAEHVGAQVGLAASRPAADFLGRETELLAILQRPKIDAADPRVRSLAWKLAGNDARTAGRLDAARERYRKALELMPSDVGTLVAAAALELRDNQLATAATGIERALTLAPDDVDANLVKIELDLRNQQLDAATARIAALRGRTPPLTGAAPRGQLELLDGQRLAATGDATAALSAYGKAKDILGAGDVAPTIAIATLLSKQAGAADQAGQPDQAASLRKQAGDALAELAGKAATDPALAVTLGVAYLDAGGLVDAERWLRTAIAARPTDVEARFELAETLRRAGKQAAALAAMQDAFELAPARVDLGVALARAYESAGRDADAAKIYDQLLIDDPAEPDPDDPAAVAAAAEKAAAISNEVRMRAGRFFARTGHGARAGKQGEAILKVAADNATGQFLRGEGYLEAGKLLEARQAFQRAVDRDADPQFLDGLGRACEALYLDKHDTAARDEALRAYELATVKAPTMLNPLAAAGRLHFERTEYKDAVTALHAAYELAPSAALAGDIGKAYAMLEDRPQAIRWLETAAEGAAAADTLNTLGQLYQQTNQPRPAASALTRATELAVKQEGPGKPKVPWLDDAYRQLGELQDSLGNLGAACRAYKAYLTRDPQDEVKVQATRAALQGVKGHC